MTDDLAPVVLRAHRWPYLVQLAPPTGQVELTVQGRLRTVRLAGTERDDARVVREYRRAALTSR